MPTYLLDTNTVQCILEKSKDAHTTRIKQKLQTVLRQNAKILMSPVVFYEIARGLYKKEANRQLVFFENLTACFEWIDLEKTTWTIAAQFWAKCRQKGTPTGKGLDADALIAAQAEDYDAIVVTNNIRHFQYLGVNYESW